MKLDSIKIYTSDEILGSGDLYELQSSYNCFGVPFGYRMTPDEFGWLDFVRGKYCIADWISNNLTDDGILIFNDRHDDMSAALDADGMRCKAVMLSDDTALQKLFFWLANND